MVEDDRLYRDESWLREKHGDLSIRGMADEADTSVTTIKRWIVKFGIDSYAGFIKKECPVCGDEFTSRKSLDQQYCSKACSSEGRSTKVTVTCDHCGYDFQRKPSVVSQNEGTYCSPSCTSADRDYSGENNPMWAGRIEKTCEECDTDFRARPSRDDRRFCSRECYMSWFSENLSGENSPHWERGVVECETCDDEFHESQYRIRDDRRNFCSKECHTDWFAGYYSGDRHYNWKGGGAIDEAYTHGWQGARSRAVERDNHRCQRCGVHDDELDHTVHVHHNTPVREFDDYEKAHELENLITLCPSCHVKVESGKASI